MHCSKPIMCSYHYHKRRSGMMIFLLLQPKPNLQSIHVQPHKSELSQWNTTWNKHDTIKTIHSQQTKWFISYTEFSAAGILPTKQLPSILSITCHRLELKCDVAGYYESAARTKRNSDQVSSSLPSSPKPHKT